MDNFCLNSIVGAGLLPLCEKFRKFNAIRMSGDLLLNPRLMGKLREEMEERIKEYEETARENKLDMLPSDTVHLFLTNPSRAYLELTGECLKNVNNQVVLDQIDDIAHKFSDILEYGWRKYAFGIYIGDAPSVEIFPNVDVCILAALNLSSTMKMEDFPIHSEHITSTIDFIANFLQEQKESVETESEDETSVVYTKETTPDMWMHAEQILHQTHELLGQLKGGFTFSDILDDNAMIIMVNEQIDELEKMKERGPLPSIVEDVFSAAIAFMRFICGSLQEEKAFTMSESETMDVVDAVDALMRFIGKLIELLWKIMSIAVGLNTYEKLNDDMIDEVLHLYEYIATSNETIKRLTHFRVDTNTDFLAIMEFSYQIIETSFGVNLWEDYQTIQKAAEQMWTSKEADLVSEDEEKEEIDPDVFEYIINFLRGKTITKFSDPDTPIDDIHTYIRSYSMFLCDQALNGDRNRIIGWLPSAVSGVLSDLYHIRAITCDENVIKLSMMCADILELLIKVEYYPNIKERMYHLAEITKKDDITIRDIRKLRDCSKYILDHLIFEIDRATGKDSSVQLLDGYIHISEFAHYGLVCAVRMMQYEKEEAAKQTTNVDPWANYDPENEDDDDDDYEDAHDQMTLYAKLRKEKNEMENWLLHEKEPVVQNADVTEALKHTVEALKLSAHKQLSIIKGLSEDLKRDITSVTPAEAAKTYEKKFQKLYRRLTSKKRKK